MKLSFELANVHIDSGDAEEGRRRRRFQDELSPRSEKASDQRPIIAADKELTVGEVTVERNESPPAYLRLASRAPPQALGHPLRPSAKEVASYAGGRGRISTA